MPKVTTELDLELAKWKAKEQEIRRDISAINADARKARIGESLFGDMRGLLASAGLTLGLGALKEMFNQVDDLADMSARLNESPEVIQRVGVAAKLSGSSVEALVGAMNKLERGLGDVENSRAREALERYGFTANEILSLPLDEKIIALSEAFQRARADGSGLADMQVLLGKGAAELIPLLSMTGDELKDLFASVTTLSDDAVFRMAAMNDQFDLLAENLLTNVKVAFVEVARAAEALHAILSAFGGRVFGLGDPNALHELQDKWKAAEETTRKRLETMRQMRQAAAEGAGRIASHDGDDEARKQFEKEAEEAKQRQKRIDDLQRDIEKSRVDLLPPEERIQEMGRQLKTMLRSANPFEPTLAGLDAALKNVAAGSEEQERLLRIKREALDAQADIDRLAGTKKEKAAALAATPGEIGGAINTLMGRSANELILDSSKRQETLMERMADRLREIRDAIRRETTGDAGGLLADDIFTL